MSAVNQLIIGHEDTSCAFSDTDLLKIADDVTESFKNDNAVESKETGLSIQDPFQPKTPQEWFRIATAIQSSKSASSIFKISDYYVFFCHSNMYSSSLGIDSGNKRPTLEERLADIKGHDQPLSFCISYSADLPETNSAYIFCCDGEELKAYYIGKDRKPVELELSAEDIKKAKAIIAPVKPQPPVVVLDQVSIKPPKAVGELLKILSLSHKKTEKTRLKELRKKESEIMAQIRELELKIRPTKEEIERLRQDLPTLRFNSQALSNLAGSKIQLAVTEQDLQELEESISEEKNEKLKEKVAFLRVQENIVLAQIMGIEFIRDKAFFDSLNTLSPYQPSYQTLMEHIQLDEIDSEEKEFDTAIIGQMMDVLGGRNLEAESLLSENIPVLLTTFFISEVNRNPLSFLCGLIILDLIYARKTKDDVLGSPLYTYNDMLWNVQNQGGDHPMAHEGSFEQSKVGCPLFLEKNNDDEKPQELDMPQGAILLRLKHSRQKGNYVLGFHYKSSRLLSVEFPQESPEAATAYSLFPQDKAERDFHEITYRGQKKFVGGIASKFGITPYPLISDLTEEDLKRNEVRKKEVFLLKDWLAWQLQDRYKFGIRIGNLDKEDDKAFRQEVEGAIKWLLKSRIRNFGFAPFMPIAPSPAPASSPYSFWKAAAVGGAVVAAGAVGVALHKRNKCVLL